jgi:hypothetical protein
VASPSVRSSATTADTNAAATAVTLPATIVTGDLLLCFDTMDAGTADPSTTSPGWSRISAETAGSNVLRFAVFAKIAGASNTLDLVGQNQDASIVTLAIQDHGVSATFAELVLIAAATGTTGNANPPTTGTLAVKDWLVVAACGIDMTATGDALSAQPSGYTDIQRFKSASSTSSCATGVAVKALTGGTVDDPGTFTNTSRNWIAKTIAVPPAVPVLAGPYWGADFGGLLVPSGYSATDDFERGDGGLGSNWGLVQNALAISGGKAVMGSNPSAMRWVAGSFANNQYSEASITLSASGYYMASVIVRASDNTVNGGEFYFARLCGSCGDVSIGKRVAFSQSEFASGGTISTSIPVTATLRLEVEGTTLRAYVGGVLAVTTTDTDLAAGRPGIQISTGTATDCSIASWAGGDL